MRALALGWPLGGPDLVVADFPEAESLASFDVVLLDPASLPPLWQPYAELAPDGSLRLHPHRDLGLSRALEKLFALRQKEAEDLLAAGGILVVRVWAADEGVVIEGNPPRRLGRYSFLPKASLVSGPHHLALPQGLRFGPRRGHDVQRVDPLHPLAPYLERFSSHGYEAVLTTALGSPLTAFGRVLAQNRVGDVLALDLPVGPGRLLFLPAFPGAEGPEAWELLRSGLAALLDLPLPEATPAWLGNYELPGEKELQGLWAEFLRDKERLAQREEELNSLQHEMDVFKALLYPRGKTAFVRAACAAFRRLEFEVSDPYEGVMFLAESPEGGFLVRSSLSPFSPVGAEEHRALILALDRLRHEEGRDVRGLLLCLSQADLDPKRRGPQWEEVVERASRDHRFVLVTAYDLFRAIGQVLAGVDPRDIRKSLGEAEGPWKPRL